ncbi:hypothetical protein BH11PAT3_BH11PAT3_1000 [soil metagenome]
MTPELMPEQSFEFEVGSQVKMPAAEGFEKFENYTVVKIEGNEVTLLKLTSPEGDGPAVPGQINAFNHRKTTLEELEKYNSGEPLFV